MGRGGFASAGTPLGKDLLLGIPSRRKVFALSASSIGGGLVRPF